MRNRLNSQTIEMGCLDNHTVRPFCWMFKYLEPEIKFTIIKFSNKTNR